MKKNRHFFLFLMLNAIFQIAGAQWEPTNGPYGGSVWCFTIIDSTVYAGTDNGVFVYNGTTNSWTNTSPTQLYPAQTIASDDTGVFIAYGAGSGTSIEYSANHCATWVPVNFAFPDSVIINWINVFGGRLFVCTNGNGIYTFTYSGANLSLVNNALPGAGIQRIWSDSVHLYAVSNGTDSYVSLDNGDNWFGVDPSSYGASHVNAFAVAGGVVYAGTNTGVMISTDHGSTWSDPDPAFDDVVIYHFTVSGNTVFAEGMGASYYTIYISTDQGASWVQKNDTLDGSEIMDMAVLDSNIFVGSFLGGVFASPDYGNTWTQPNTGLQNQYIPALLENGGTLYAATYGMGLYNTTNQGNTWVPNGLTGQVISVLAASGQLLVAGGDFGTFVSANGGSTWTYPSGNISTSAITAVAILDTSIFANSVFNGLLRSDNYGSTWTNIQDTGIWGNQLTALVVNGSTLYAGWYGEILSSVDGGYTWTVLSNTLPPNVPVNVLLFSDSNIFAGTSGQGIYVSANNGSTWTAINNGLPDSQYVNSLIANGGALYAGTYSGTYQTYNNGAVWAPLNSAYGQLAAACLLADSSGVYAGTGAGVWRLPLNNSKTCSALFTLYADTSVANTYYALNQAGGAAPLSYIWNWGDGDTSSGPAPSHTYADSGYYTICLNITDNIGCTSSYCDSSTYLRGGQNLVITVNVVTQLPTSVPVVASNALPVTVYPNPSNGNWHLSVGNDLVGSALQVYDQQGRMVMKDEIKSTNNELAAGALAPGVYYLRISNTNNNVVKKLVKL